MKKLYIVLLITLPIISFAQEDDVFYVVETMPQFPGGQKAMDSFVYANFKMPPEAIEVGAEGKIFIEFIVDTTGKMTNIKMLRDGVGWGCANEALRVIKLMANIYIWAPGEQRHRKVNVRYRYPIIIKNVDAHNGNDKVTDAQFKGVDAHKKKDKVREPDFKGGLAALDRLFFLEFQQPIDALRAGAYGTLQYVLTVSAKGVVEKITIYYDGAGFGCAEEGKRALNMIFQTHHFRPGEINGEPAETEYIYQVDLMVNNTMAYIPEPDEPPHHFMGDEALKQKILKRITKKYNPPVDRVERAIVVDMLISERGDIVIFTLIKNEFDAKMARRLRGAFMLEQGKFNPAQYGGIAVRSRLRFTITNKDIETYLNIQR